MEWAIELGSIEAIKILEKYHAPVNVCELFKKYKIKENIKEYYKHKCSNISKDSSKSESLSSEMLTDGHMWYENERTKKRDKLYKKIRIKWEEDNIFVIVFKVISYIILSIWFLFVD
jgi:hypothetical protein